jgi:serine/threonine-protein kinase HipA
MTTTHVYLDSPHGPRPVGRLFSNLRGGRLSSTFSYADDYLETPGVFQIDPALPLTSGSWPLGGPLPRAFADAAPDRWGRNLILKRNRAEGGGGVDDLGFLLGVADITRQGALRFARSPGGPFEHPEPTIPRLIELPRLLAAANEVVADPHGLHRDAVHILLSAGSGSLGGARPKAAVRDDRGLLLAKFPHASDAWDVMAWEKTALDLAARAGIAVPSSDLLTVDGASVLLERRFDRVGSRRLGYVSALTLAERDDGDPTDYVDLADAIARWASDPTGDLEELARRILFGVAIGNTDDHFRNTGFLRTTTGWAMSPAFDLNPNPEPGAPHATAVAGSRHATTMSRAVADAAAVFGLDGADVARVAAQVIDGVAAWRDVAARNGVSVHEVDAFADSMNHGLGALGELV